MQWYWEWDKLRHFILAVNFQLWKMEKRFIAQIYKSYLGCKNVNKYYFQYLVCLLYLPHYCCNICLLMLTPLLNVTNGKGFSLSFKNSLIINLGTNKSGKSLTHHWCFVRCDQLNVQIFARLCQYKYKFRWGLVVERWWRSARWAIESN